MQRNTLHPRGNMENRTKNARQRRTKPPSKKHAKLPTLQSLFLEDKPTNRRNHHTKENMKKNPSHGGKRMSCYQCSLSEEGGCKDGEECECYCHEKDAESWAKGSEGEITNE